MYEVATMNNNVREREYSVNIVYILCMYVYTVYNV